MAIVPGELQPGHAQRYLRMMGVRDFTLQLLNLVWHRALDLLSRIVQLPHSYSVTGAARRARVPCSLETRVKAPEFDAQLREQE